MKQTFIIKYSKYEGNHSKGHYISLGWELGDAKIFLEKKWYHLHRILKDEKG